MHEKCITKFLIHHFLSRDDFPKQNLLCYSEGIGKEEIQSVLEIIQFTLERRIDLMLTVFASLNSKDLSSTLYKQQFVAKASIMKF